MNFDIDDLLSKELITLKELELIKVEIQDLMDELQDDESEDQILELEESLDVIEHMINQCDNYGESLCTEEYLNETVLGEFIDEIVRDIGSKLGTAADIVKANLNIDGMKDDLISEYTCVTITYDNSSYYFYAIY